MVKQAGGVLTPADDHTADYMTTVKTDSHVRVKVSRVRNYQFHKKVFAFFNFVFAHWSGELAYEFMDEKAQFDAFRKQLTILAGYRKQIVNIRTHTCGYEAESLSYENMDEDTFRQCYTALINAAMKYVFKGSDEQIYNKLVSFF